MYTVKRKNIKYSENIHYSIVNGAMKVYLSFWGNFYEHNEVKTM